MDQYGDGDLSGLSTSRTGRHAVLSWDW